MSKVEYIVNLGLESSNFQKARGVINALLWHNFSIFPCNLKEIVRKKGMG
jgi:hypothetical protein